MASALDRERPLMLTDADCGFCMRTARLVPRLGVRVDQSTVQGEDLAALGVDAERAALEMPLVRTDGSVAYGAQAWGETLQTGPAPLKALGSLMLTPIAMPAVKRVYHWIATNRHRLPGGTPACTLPLNPDSSPTPPAR